MKCFGLSFILEMSKRIFIIYEIYIQRHSQAIKFSKGVQLALFLQLGPRGHLLLILSCDQHLFASQWMVNNEVSSHTNILDEIATAAEYVCAHTHTHNTAQQLQITMNCTTSMGKFGPPVKSQLQKKTAT